MVKVDSQIAVYILASARNGTLYTGVTSALVTRVQQHKFGTFEGFSKTYGCKSLVWYKGVRKRRRTGRPVSSFGSG